MLTPIHNLWSPDTGTEFKPTIDTAAMQDSVEAALEEVASRRPITTSGTLVGGNPPAGTNFIEKTGTTGIIPTNSNGDSNIPYPTAFPNGVISASIERIGFSTGIGGTIHVLANEQSKSQLNFRVFSTTGESIPNSNLFRYSYRVIGW